MKRRNFLFSVGASLVGYRIGSKAKSTLRFDHPPIVFDYDKEPATAVPDENGSLLLKVPENVDSDSIVVTYNEYARPDIVYEKEEIQTNGEKITYTNKYPIENDVFAVTLYEKTENGLNYIGESNPLRRGYNGTEEVVERIKKENEERRPMKREVKRGHYKITVSTDRRNASFPISHQKHEMSSRIIGYGKVDDVSNNNHLLKNIGKRILDQLDADDADQYQKIRILTDFVQNMTWKGDVRTTGKFEYIREPEQSLVNLYGDCKDRTVINNGLLTSVLGINTSILFTPGHMLTGIDYTDLNKSSIDKMSSNSDNGEIGLHEGKKKSFVPVDSTASHDIGIEYPAPVFAIYTDHYQLKDKRGFYEHIKRSVSMVSSRDYSAI